MISKIFANSLILTTILKKTLCYARVSSHDQKKDLETQVDKLKNYCIDNKIENFEVIQDLGSGLNYKKKGFKQLLNLILNQHIDHLILNHKDRLLRFGSEIIFSICQFFNIKVTIIEKQDVDFENELVQNVIEIMTVFTSKLYGRRSHKNKKKIIESAIQTIDHLTT
jgi:putative resolvase